MTSLDKRLNAFRPDIADARLQGQVTAARFVAGRPATICAGVADMLSHPRREAGLNSQLLRGDDVMIYDEADGFAWIQAGRDGYVGYVACDVLVEPTGTATHLVTAPRTFLYPVPDLKRRAVGVLSMGSAVVVRDVTEEKGTYYAVLSTGEAVIAGHLRAVGEEADDYVAVAEQLLTTPYLWGGCSAFGIDCSGLVQLSMRMAGHNVLRDSDMQAESVGAPLEPGDGDAGLRRGDLVFWKGHVAIMCDAETVIHANGHTMLVSREKLTDAVERIGYLYGGPTGYRRPVPRQ